MKQYTVNHQNYQVLQTRQTKAPFSVQFQWGKFDFFFHFKKVDSGMSTDTQFYSNKSGQMLSPSLLQISVKNERFDFVKPTAHGLSLEETLWRHEGKRDYYMELPKNLFAVATQFCATELGLTAVAS